MPVLEYNAGSVLKRFDVNGIFAVDTFQVVEIARARLPAHAVFLVSDEVSSNDVWEGERQPTRHWSPGDVAFLPERSELRSVADRHYRETVISLADARLVETARMYIERSEVDIRYADITSPDASGIARVLHGLITSGECSNWPLLTDSLVQAMSVAIVRRFEPRRAALVDGKRMSLDRPRQRRAMDFVEANIGKPIRLAEMAAAAALSPFHFSRSFKSTMGMSPTRYVLQRRIREAQQMLRMSSAPLAEVALACGFASQSHFTTAFKQEIGVTPGQYRSSANS